MKQSKDTATFAPGTNVTVPCLNARGVVVRIVNRKYYLVRIGNAEVRLGAEQLVECTRTKGKKKKSGKNEKKVKLPKRKSKQSCTIDLHGLYVKEAIERVDAQVNLAIMKGYRSLEVVHGIGGGKIKQALFDYCKSSEVIAQVQTDIQNPGTSRLYFFDE